MLCYSGVERMRVRVDCRAKAKHVHGTVVDRCDSCHCRGMRARRRRNVVQVSVGAAAAAATAAAAEDMSICCQWTNTQIASNRRIYNQNNELVLGSGLHLV